MELDPKDQALAKLLTELKNANVEYPQWLWESRRESFLKQVANVGAAGGFVSHAAKSTKPKNGPAGGSPGAGTLLETFLVVAIVAEAGAAAYLYRDKITTLIQSSISSTSVERVGSPNPIPSSASITSINLYGSQTPTMFPSGTPTPGFTFENDIPGSDQITSTPGPVGGPNGNNGNHYGQTPKPDRTKKPPGDGNGNGSNNKPPKPKKTP